MLRILQSSWSARVILKKPEQTATREGVHEYRNIRRNMVVIQQVRRETMKTFLNKVDENRLDVLSVDMEIDIRKEYKNITRHSGRMVPVIDWRIALYINGNKLGEDEVFVEDEFLKSLIIPGKYPMFTCTCGIFGCGGTMLKSVMRMIDCFG